MVNGFAAPLEDSSDFSQSCSRELGFLQKKYVRLPISNDACFRLQRSDVRRDEGDVSLVRAAVVLPGVEHVVGTNVGVCDMADANASWSWVARLADSDDEGSCPLNGDVEEDDDHEGDEASRHAGRPSASVTRARVEGTSSRRPCGVTGTTLRNARCDTKVVIGAPTVHPSSGNSAPPDDEKSSCNDANLDGSVSWISFL